MGGCTSKVLASYTCACMHISLQKHHLQKLIFDSLQNHIFNSLQKACFGSLTKTDFSIAYKNRFSIAYKNRFLHSLQKVGFS
jgi:hypothetical protein